jgi:WD40 repeat protein
MALRLLKSIQSHAAPIYGMSGGDAPNHFFTCSGDMHIASWQVPDLTQLPLAVKLESPVYSCYYITSLGLLIAGTSFGDFHVIDLNEKKEIKHIQHHQAGIFDFVFDPSDHQLIVAGGDGRISIWSVPEFKLIRSIPICDGKIRQMAISRDCSMLALACGDGQIRVTDLIFFNEIGTMEGHADGATAVAWHPNKPVLVTGGKDAHLKCWNINEDYKNVLSIPAHQFAIYSIVFDPSGRHCFTASRDKTIKQWNAHDFSPLYRVNSGTEGHTHSVNKLLCIEDQLISCGDDRRINCYQIVE